MANTKSAQKNIRKSATATEQNRRIRSRLKTLARKVSEAEGEAVEPLAREFVSALDKAAKVGIIHPNKASRHKASLAGKV